MKRKLLQEKKTPVFFRDRLKKEILLLVFLFVGLSDIEAQVIFREDFGMTTTRRKSPYMPTGSYLFANPNGDTNEKVINDGYYAVIDPTHIKDNWPTSGWSYFWTGPAPAGAPGSFGNPDTTDSTGNPNGAVMVLNAGDTPRIFYRRKVTLEADAFYSLTFNRFVVNPNCIISVEIIDPITSAVLGGGGYPAATKAWRPNGYNFKMPAGALNKEVWIELKTAQTDGSYNDLYVDDIILTRTATGAIDTPVLLAPSVTTTPDTDADKVANIYDLDDDNDGVEDKVEGAFCSDRFVNGGFESPVIVPTFKDVSVASNLKADGFTAGWHTSEPDGMIEYWQTGLLGFNAPEGKQLAELNAERDKSCKIYQIMCLNGEGGEVKWSLKHRGRNGIDTAEVQIGSSLSTLTVQQRMLDDKNAWGEYSGTYKIPKGQKKLVFAIWSVDVGYNGPSGNLIDDVIVTINENCVDTDEDGITDLQDLDSDNDGCSDANEHHNSRVADGNDDKIYGLGIPTVGTYGRVQPTGSVYTNYYSDNAVTATLVTVNSEPVNQTLGICNRVTFSIGATAVNTKVFSGGIPNYNTGIGTNSTDKLVYQWQLDGVDLTDNAIYLGTKTANLTIMDLNGLNGKKYTVVVTHQNNVCYKNEYSAVLTVTPIPSAPTASNQTLCLNEGKILSDLTVYGENIKYYDVLTGGTNIAASTALSPGTYYVSQTVNGCESTRTPVVVSNQKSPNAGIDRTWTVCSSVTITEAELFRKLGGNPDVGGTWSSLVSDPNTYIYTVAATSPCETAASAKVLVTKIPTPNAGVNAVLKYCKGKTITIEDVFAALGPLANPGGIWSHTYNGVGTYTYTVKANSPCDTDATASVEVIKIQEASAGSDNTIEICSGTVVTKDELLSALGLNSTIIGTWSPQIPVTGVGRGTFTFTVAATSPCTTAAVATVTVSEYAKPNAGGNASIKICAGSTTTEQVLFEALGNAVALGGTWSPALTPNVGVGDYTYTVSTTTPCVASSSAKISVSEIDSDAPRDISGVNKVCVGKTIILSYDGLSGGFWTSSNTQVASINITTGVVTGVTAGTTNITYTEAETGGCSNASNSFSVTVTDLPVIPTITNATATQFCTGDAVTLTSSASSNNSWYKDGIVIEGATGENYKATEAGFYTVRTTNTEGCLSEFSSAVEVVVNETPAAPTTTSSTQKFCSLENKKVSDLVAVGTNLKWYDSAISTTAIDTNSLLTSNTYYGSQTLNGCESTRIAIAVTIDVSPAKPVIISEAAKCLADGSSKLTNYDSELIYTFNPVGPGINSDGKITGMDLEIEYTLTVKANNELGCNEVSLPFKNSAKLGIPEAPSAVSQKFCSSENSKVSDLVAIGTNLKWYDSNSSNTILTGNEQLITETYYVSQTSSNDCESTLTPVEVTIIKEATAGTDGSLQICSGSLLTSSQLFGALGGTPDTGGTWSPALVGAGTYRYTVNASSPCETDSFAQVEVSEIVRPNAGLNSALYICPEQTFTEIDLFNALEGSPDSGGTWSPTIDGEGVYFYTVPTKSSCYTDASSWVRVATSKRPNAGTDGDLKICSGSTITATHLFAKLGGTPDTGGTWSPALAGAGTYTYTVTSGSTCYTESATARIVVSDIVQLTAGTNGVQKICSGSTVTETQLFAALGGTPDSGGTWSPTLAGAGTYTYTVGTNSNCSQEAQSEIVVTEQAMPNAGINSTLVICPEQNFTEVDLFNALNGTPDVGGTWSPTIAGEGTYMYTVTSTLPCLTNAISRVLVTSLGPNAGSDGTLKICSGSLLTSSQLFGALGGTPDTGGTWSPTLAGAGTYTYTLTAISPCLNNVISQVVVSEQSRPNAGTNGTLKICSGSTITTTQLFAALGGTPDTGGIWSPTLAGAGTYTYTLTATSPCADNAISQVVVTEDTSQIITSNVVQPTCSTPTGSVLLSGLPTGHWTINPGGIEGTGSSYRVTNLAAGSITSFTVLNDSGCISMPSANVTLSNVICANSETIASIDGNSRTVTTSLLLNDTLNGQPVVIGVHPGHVKLTGLEYPENFVFNADGSITIPANTPTGTYLIKYTICEISNPENCSTVTSTVSVVSLANISAVDDGRISINGNTGAVNFINVLNNDLLNGRSIIPQEVTLHKLSQNPYFLFNGDGTVTALPNSPIGNFDLSYEICENSNLINCSQAILKVHVEAASIALIKSADFEDENKDGVTNVGETITYHFKITNTGNATLQNVMVTDELQGIIMQGLPISLEAGEENEQTFKGVYTITQRDIENGSISNQAIVKGYTLAGFEVTDKSDPANTTSDNPTITHLDGCSIKVFNAVSPNDDGFNDELFIQGLECFSDNTIEIYNSLGILVFQKKQYDNTISAFKGRAEGSRTIKNSEYLPIGTYFYILKYTDNNGHKHDKSGYLYLSK